MKIPNIQNYQDCRQFLADVYATNRKNGGVGSFRFYAGKLKWPVSYFNEVIQGKRKISLQRVLQFGLFLKLDAVDLERLIYLCMLDSESSSVQRYFQTKLATEAKTDGMFRVSQTAAPPPENIEIVPASIYRDISLLAIYDLISWSDGKLPPEDFAKYLFTFPELKDKKQVANKIEILEHHGYIQVHRKKNKIVGFEKSTKRLFFSVDKDTVTHMRQYADNYSRMIQHPNQRGWIGSGFVNIHKDQMAAVKKRVISFRNWMLEIDKECANLNRKKVEDSLVFQFDLNLFCLIDGVTLGYPRLNDWMTAPASEA